MTEGIRTSSFSEQKNKIQKKIQEIDVDINNPPGETVEVRYRYEAWR